VSSSSHLARLSIEFEKKTNATDQTTAVEARGRGVETEFDASACSRGGRARVDVSDTVSRARSRSRRREGEASAAAAAAASWLKMFRAASARGRRDRGGDDRRS
jgi:hypothetical protein